MIESLSSRIHFAVFGPDFSYDDGFPAVADTAFLREHVSGGKTLAAFSVALPNSGGFDEPTEYETHLRRYFADGTLDRTFGRNGDLNLGQNSGLDVVPGSRIISSSFDNTRLRAYTLNGRVDTTFGGGDGVAEIPTNAVAGDGSSFGSARVVDVRDDGSLLTQTQLYVSVPGRSRYQYTVALLNPDGSLNPNFGYKGVVSFSEVGGDLTPMLTDRALYLLVDRIGATNPPSGDIIKLSTDGKTADTSFGGDGRVAIPGFVDNLTEQPDGKLLYLDHKYDDDKTLYRLNTDGSPNTTFSGDGKIAINYTGSQSGLPLSSSGQNVLVDGQNRIVVSAVNSIFRYSPNGTIDAYPFNGSVPFPTLMTAVDDAGNVTGGDRKRYGLVPPQQLDQAGVVQIISDNRDDTIAITDAGNGKLRVVVNGESRLFRVRDVKGFNVQTYDGELNFSSALAVPVTLIGGNGDADVTLGGGSDSIEFGLGNHTVAMGGGNDHATLGKLSPGDDEPDPGANHRHTVTGTSGNKTIEVSTGSAIVNLPSGDHDVDAYSRTHDNVVTIAGGNNRVRLGGRDGGDSVTIGGRGRNDVTVFGLNTNVTTGTGPDTILAISPYGTINTTGGDDVVTIRNFTDAPTRGVTVYGGSGNDTIFCDDGYNSLATVYGGPGDDKLTGNTLSQRLYGENGNDTLDGGEGNDILYGGDLDDVIIGGGQSDRLYGDAGNDRLYGQFGNDTLSGGTGDDRLFAQVGNDQLFGDEGNDRFYSDDDRGNHVMHGGDGNDVFNTRNGKVDTLFGDAGDDIADADANDVLDSVSRV
jgi:uncharacterized delta-60 repeat protein